MNKIMKKMLISSITGLMIGMIPFTGYAATITEGSPEREQGVSKFL